MMTNECANREAFNLKVILCEAIIEKKNTLEKYSTFIRNGKPFTRKLIITNLKHGMSNSRIYSIWKGMRHRCSNPNRPKYKYYGGKGIKVCKEWDEENGFINFYSWSINNGYSDTLTIDRIDSSKDYCPENCQWITLRKNISKQSSNRRFPKYKFYAENEELNIIVTFYFTNEFEDKYEIDPRRISECCSGKRVEYKGWKFFKQILSMIERQETIPSGSTMEDEFPLEVRDAH
jgi:hypothetical protein